MGDNNTISYYQKVILVGVMIFLYVAGFLLWDYSHTVSKPNPPLIVLVTESLKLVTSVYLHTSEQNRSKKPLIFSRMLKAGYWQKNWRFCIPATMYFLNNLLHGWALSFIPSHVHAMLYNVKLLMVAAIAVFFLGQKIVRQQWYCLLVITVGLVFISAKPGRKAQDTDSGFSILPIVVALIMGLQSAAAGAYLEFLYKKEEVPDSSSTNQDEIDAIELENNVHVQNIKLYVVGVITAFLMNALKGSFRMNLHWTHVAIVFVNCYSGMASGFIMKYLDNVVRNIVVALGTVALTVVSAFMLGNELTFLFLMGAPLIVAGSYYFNKLKQKKPTAKPVRKHETEEENNTEIVSLKEHDELDDIIYEASVMLEEGSPQQKEKEKM